MKAKCCLALCFFLSFSIGTAWADTAIGGTEDLWNGFRRITPEIPSLSSVQIMFPEEAAPDMPWLWCSSSPDERLPLVKALLEKGFHVLYLPRSGSSSFSESLAQWDQVHQWVREHTSFASKAVVEASGDGALAAFSWAAKNPEQVGSIISVLPWLNLNSAGEARISEEEWTSLAQWLGVEDPTLFSETPLANATALGQAEIPMLLIKELPVAAWENEQYNKFYFDYRTAGRGEYDVITAGSNASVEEETLLFHQLYFLLKNSGQLAPTSIDKPVSADSSWTVADMSALPGVFAVDDVLVLEKGGDMTGIRWHGDLPEGSYEISLEAMRLAGSDFFCGLTVPYEDSAFSLIVGGWGGTCVGISNLNWLDAYNNETAHFKNFNDHEWYAIRLRVDGDHIEAWIDGEKLVDVEVDGRDVDIRWEMMEVKPLGIATWRTASAIRNFRISAL